jgi:NADPH2:quinone reductase
VRAFVIDRIGDRGRIADVANAEPAPDEVLIRVNAVGLVASDWRIRAGSRQGRQEHFFPAVMGLDFAGEVVGAPGGDHNWTIGDRVFGIAHKRFIGAGALAEFLVMPCGGPIAHTPAYLSDAQAASLVSGWLTALAALDVTPVSAGDNVLLLGASGGVGSVLTQCLAHRGVRVVAISRAANRDYVRRLGAADVVPYDTGDVVATARGLQPDGFDALIDLMSGPDRFDELATLVRQGGLAVSAVRAADEQRMSGLNLRVANVAANPSSARLSDLGGRWRAEGFALPELEVLPFAAVADGIDRIEQGHVRGKLVVTVP